MLFLIHSRRPQTSPYPASKGFLYFLLADPFPSQGQQANCYDFCSCHHISFLDSDSFPSCQITFGPQDSLSISKSLTIISAEPCLPYNKTHRQVPGINMQTSLRRDYSDWCTGNQNIENENCPFCLYTTILLQLPNRGSVYFYLFTYLAFGMRSDVNTDEEWDVTAKIWLMDSCALDYKFSSLSHVNLIINFLIFKFL